MHRYEYKVIESEEHKVLIKEINVLATKGYRLTAVCPSPPNKFARYYAYMERDRINAR